MIEADIATGLLRRLSTIALSPSLPIAYPNVPYSPTGAAYLRASHIPANVEPAAITRWDRRTGILQVDVMWPENNGITGGLQTADEVAAHFGRGTRFEENGVLIQINSTPVVAGAIHEPPYMQIPVSISYECFHSLA